MKTKLYLTITIALIAMMAEAQTPGSFWVIENNLTQKQSTIIHFYDTNSNLIHREVVSGKNLNISRRKDRKFLNRKLKEVLEQEEIATRTSAKN